MHLSSATQLAETARIHFAARSELTLIVIDSCQLGDTLRWETSRAGALFPHVYGPVPLGAVLETHELVGEQAGVFAFPAEIREAEDQAT